MSTFLTVSAIVISMKKLLLILGFMFFSSPGFSETITLTCRGMDFFVFDELLWEVDAQYDYKFDLDNRIIESDRYITYSQKNVKKNETYKAPIGEPQIDYDGTLLNITKIGNGYIIGKHQRREDNGINLYEFDLVNNLLTIKLIGSEGNEYRKAYNCIDKTLVLKNFAINFGEKNTHQLLLDNKLVILYEGEEWSIQFLPNNKMMSEWRGERNYKLTWQKLNDKGLYKINYPNKDGAQYWDINVSDQIFTITDATNKITTYKILKPKDEKSKKKRTKPSPDDNKVVAASSGTGFFVSSSGHIVTNFHVIEECNSVKVHYKGSEKNVQVLFTDKTNDLAIIKANVKPDKVYAVSDEDVSLLEDIIVAGYPLGKKVSAAIKTSKGSVTALAGYNDNYSNFQIDAALNSGNSGGPIMNQKGNVLGVAVAHYGKKAGVESFNFGVKSSTLKTFASSNNFKFVPASKVELTNKDLGKLITEATIYLECWMSVAKIKQFIAEEESLKAFFSDYK